MDIKTTKSWSNRLLSLYLVTAFLAMQWTPAHIHLGEQHDHDGTHHQHQAETHAHNLTQQAIATDFSHQASHTNIIVLALECNFPQKEKQDNHLIALVTKATTILDSSLLVNIAIPVVTNTRLSYFELSTVNPRAPPQIS